MAHRRDRRGGQRHVHVAVGRRPDASPSSSAAVAGAVDRVPRRAAGAAAARAVPRRHDVGVRPRRAVVAAQREVVPLVPARATSASSGRRCSVASTSTGRPPYYWYTIVVAARGLRRRRRHPPQPDRPRDRRHPRQRAGGAELRRVGRARQADRVHHLRRHRRRRPARCSSTSTRRSASPRYGPGESLDVFVAAVIGGLGSLGGAVLGALYLRGTQWFITAPEWRLLSTGVGVLFVLLVLPGGLASLRRPAARRRTCGWVLRRRTARRRDAGDAEAPVADARALEQVHVSRFVAARPPPGGVAARRLRRRSRPTRSSSCSASTPSTSSTAPRSASCCRRSATPSASTSRTCSASSPLAGVAALALQVPIAQFADRRRRVPLVDRRRAGVGRASPG